MGNLLKSYRTRDDHEALTSYIPEDCDEADPADQDEDMQRKLEESSKMMNEQMDKVREISLEKGIPTKLVANFWLQARIVQIGSIASIFGDNIYISP